MISLHLEAQRERTLFSCKDVVRLARLKDTLDWHLVFHTAILHQLFVPRDASLNVPVDAGSLEDTRPKELKLTQLISLIKSNNKLLEKNSPK